MPAAMALVVLFSIAILWNFHRFILNYSIYTYGFLSPQNGGGDPPPRYSFPLMLWGDDAGGVHSVDYGCRAGKAIGRQYLEGGLSTRRRDRYTVVF